MPKKQITNKDLARIIKKGFVRNNKWFNLIDNGFGIIESRFDRIDKKLDHLAQGHKEIIQMLDKGAYSFRKNGIQKPS